MNIWEQKIKDAIDKIFNMKNDETLRFKGFVVKRYKTPFGCRWNILSSDEKTCKGALYAENYNDDTQFTNDFIGLIF